MPYSLHECLSAWPALQQYEPVEEHINKNTGKAEQPHTFEKTADIALGEVG